LGFPHLKLFFEREISVGIGLYKKRAAVVPAMDFPQIEKPFSSNASILDKGKRSVNVIMILLGFTNRSPLSDYAAGP
jgi:hypothetical protein